MDARCMRRAPILLALASRRKSRSCCDMPLTERRTCERMNAIIEVSVPISGEKPFLGPTIVRSASSECAGGESRVNPESPVVRAAVVFRKFLRLGMHSNGNMAISVHSTNHSEFHNERVLDPAPLSDDQARA